MNMGVQLALVAVGGAAGAVLRFLMGAWVGGWMSSHVDSAFPWGIFVVNVVGCFLFGFLFAACFEQQTLHQSMALLLLVGLCGAFTTFSTFAFDIVMLVEAGKWIVAISYILASVITCLVGMIIGLYLGRMLLSG